MPDEIEPTIPELSAEDAARLSGQYRGRTFPLVHKGTVYCFGLKEHLRPPLIAPGESAIRALAALDVGVTLGIAGGTRGHLFYFHPGFGVAHVKMLDERPIEGGALLALGGSRVVGGWWGAHGGGLFRHDATNEAAQGIEQFRGAASPVEPISLPNEGDGIAALAGPDDDGTVYALALPSHTLVALDTKTGETQALAHVEAAAPVLAVLPEGGLLGAHAEGQLWRYSRWGKEIEPLNAFAPCQMGKRYASGVQSLLVASGGAVYGGTSTDGFLFRYDRFDDRVVNLGKPNRQSHIRALVEGRDGRIYGIVEEPRGMAHLFTYNPDGGGFDDLGIVGTAFPQHWTAHSLGSMSVGPHGEIYLGETDTLSHLFVYHPPM